MSDFKREELPNHNHILEPMGGGEFLHLSEPNKRFSYCLNESGRCRFLSSVDYQCEFPWYFKKGRESMLVKIYDKDTDKPKWVYRDSYLVALVPIDLHHIAKCKLLNWRQVL